MFTRKSLILPILLSLFIYLEYFDISLQVINTIVGLSAFLLMYQLNKKELFTAGFLTGVLWFWWLGYSFVYYDLSYLIPLVIIAIGLIYALLFFLIGLFENIYYKIFYIFFLTYIEPFSFNWFKLELIFIESYLGVSKLEFFLILLLSGLFIKYKDDYKKTTPIVYGLGIIGLYFVNFTNPNLNPISEPNLKIYKYETNIPQELRWDKKYKQTIINQNFKAIQEGINNNDDLIILPETAFPLILNYQKSLIDQLLLYSKEITILTGSLYQKDNQLYNSTYLFNNGTVQTAHKVVLVPFGEAVPAPEKLRNWINDTFYNGASDYLTASEPTTFDIKGEKFRNAICYEATTDKIFDNLDTPYIIAISNNGWFTPSIQPTLQKLLMRYYENRYHTKILSVSNR